MPDVTRHDRDQAWSCDLRDAVDGSLDLTLDHLPNFFLRVEVLVNGGPPKVANRLSIARSAQPCQRIRSNYDIGNGPAESVRVRLFQ